MLMAQGSYILRSVSDPSSDDCVPNYLEIDCGFQSGVDCLESVDSFQNGATIKRLSLKRRPRAAVNNVEKTQSGISSSLWYSAESLSSSGSDDTRLLGMSSAARGRPPLPPPHGSSSDNNKPSRIESPTTSQMLTESKPQPAARSLALQRHSPAMEKPTVETHRHLTQEAMNQTPPQPFPRRRLASFGGVSSPGSLSPFTGLGAYNQNNNGNKPSDAGADTNAHLGSSLGSRGSTGSLRLSPQSSGRTTPVSSLGSMHLQHVRDQMVVALQRLKELEEQVKIIPILQVKISVLQEEKRQLVSQLKNQSDGEGINDVMCKRSYSLEGSGLENMVKSEEEIKRKGKGDLSEFKQLAEEMQALERAIKGGQFQTRRGKSESPLHEKSVKSVAVGTDKEMTITSSKPSKENKSTCTDEVKTRSVATEASDITLGIYTEQEAELDAQQLINAALKERICQLEADLKESALQTELTRLKLELQAAGARNRVDKACSARPSTATAGTEAKPDTKSQGVGNHTELHDASTGEPTEVKTVGVSCEPKMENVCTGPDEPMSHWEVRERVVTREVAVGIQVFTRTQGVGTETKVCDAESNTEMPAENLWSKKEMMKCHSVPCGNCCLDMMSCEAKQVVSRGMATDPVSGVDLGIMASPQTASQRTNTVSSSVSRFTNTRQAFSTDSSTNTLLSTQNKHTNTAHASTRTVSVGNRVRDTRCATDTRTVGVGTANLAQSISKQTQEAVIKVTRDTGVGFTNINENFLVGLKTRNMASGPSHLPDPIKTKSIGVGEGRIRDLSASPSTPGPTVQQTTQFQWDQELNHYIEKMHWILREHGDLLTEGCSDHKTSTKLLCNPQPAANRDFQPPSQFSVDSSKSDKANTGICQQADSDVKRMIKMLEQQASSAQEERSANAGKPLSVAKKQNGEQCCSSIRRSMKFMRVTTGLDPVSDYEHSAVERTGNKTLREAPQDGVQARKGKDGSSKGLKGSARLYTQQRCKLSERMFSACQALKMHLSDEAALSSGELQDCLQTLQQEWFSVSSHKSASPDTLRDYLSTFRVISPSVLRHIVNMADGNGNTALHYSVSHSNFGVVKTLLDAEVCNVNQQNTAGYTPIMLAALAAVENPENMRVLERLFAKGDVNAKASQAGQTALMLAVSHGRMDVVQALLAQGAEVNIQDDEGSTALMCASEHGHADIVKLLLARPECDATLTDSDDSTALSIALEAGHNDIAVLLYAHANFSRGHAGQAPHPYTLAQNGKDIRHKQRPLLVTVESLTLPLVEETSFE